MNDIQSNFGTGRDSRERDDQAPSLLQRTCNVMRGVFGSLMHGIPVELTGVVTPEKKQQVFREYRENLKKTKDPDLIKNQVGTMLKLMAKHFPGLKKDSMQWRQVRGYLFDAIGLWGRE